MSDMERVLEMLGAMGQRMDTMSQRMDTMNQRMDTMQEDLTSLREDMATKEDLQQAKSEMMVLMEAYFTPKFELLADQIKLIEEKQVPIEALEQAEDRLDVLEAVVKSHSAEIRKLKRAQ